MDHYARTWGIAGTGGFEWSAYLRAAIAAGQGGTGVLGVRLMWPTLQEVEARLDGSLESAFGPVERQPVCPAHCLARIILHDFVVAALEMFPERFVLGVGHEADQHGHER